MGATGCLQSNREPRVIVDRAEDAQRAAVDHGVASLRETHPVRSDARGLPSWCFLSASVSEQPYVAVYQGRSTHPFKVVFDDLGTCFKGM